MLLLCSVHPVRRGEHGQLGRTRGSAFAGKPERSPILSVAHDAAASRDANQQGPVVGVVAFANCSASFGRDGSLLATAGKCTAGKVLERVKAEAKRLARSRQDAF